MTGDRVNRLVEFIVECDIPDDVLLRRRRGLSGFSFCIVRQINVNVTVRFFVTCDILRHGEDGAGSKAASPRHWP